MTLHKAIEAAREALERRTYEDCEYGPETHEDMADFLQGRISDALSTIPAKPLSEEEIKTLLVTKVLPFNESEITQALAYKVIRALRDAGVLYVEEKS